MNLQKIQQSIADFKTYLSSSKSEDQLYKWESLFHFQQNWDLEAPEFLEAYDKSLHNSVTKRLWKADQYVPKKMMSLFIKMDADYVKHTFQDLFREAYNVGDRIDRFRFYCDELLATYKTEYPLSIENNHYHDYFIISLYLSFRYPEQYALYEFASFQKGLQRLGVANLPATDDIERYFKVCRTIWKFMEKDEEVWAVHQKRLRGKNLYREKSLLLVHEFFQVIGN